jgi:hypothetical protein
VILTVQIGIGNIFAEMDYLFALQDSSEASDGQNFDPFHESDEDQTFSRIIDDSIDDICISEGVNDNQNTPSYRLERQPLLDRSVGARFLVYKCCRLITYSR